jgi:hypothetical protein
MKKLILIAVIFSVIAGFAFPQSMPGGFESPQSAATQGRYRSASDNYIRPDAFNGVSFKNYFLMTSFAAANRATLGFAAKVNDLYIGVGYIGSFWANYTAYNFTEIRSNPWDTGVKTFSEYNTITPTGIRPENRLALLFGLSDMGFRITYSTTHESFLSEDILYNGEYYKNNSTAIGIISPQLAWALTKDLTSNGVRPWATIDLNFNRDYQKSEIYESDGTTLGKQVNYSRNYKEPVFNAGIGGYTFYRNQSGFRASADLDYSLTMRFYNSEYSYIDSSDKYKISTIKGTNINDALTETSSIQNLITPSVSGQWSGGNLALRFKLNLPVTLTNGKSTGLAINDEDPSSGKLEKHGNDSKSTSIGFAPNLRLAAQWKLLPNLTLNAGGRITVNTISRTTTKSDSYEQGVTPPDSVNLKQITKTFGGTANQLTAGITFNATNNMTFEASSGVTIGGVNVFSSEADGLLNFTRLLVSLRF